MLLLWWFTFAFLLLRFLVTAVNYWFPQELKASTEQEKELVSILIPARNEERNIATILHSILEQDYKFYEVLVLDDQSSDRTAEIVEEIAASDRRIKLLKGAELPPGIMGKNWACHQLALQAKGSYLLFLDADVRLKEGLINNSIQYLKKENLALLSVCPDQVMQSLEEKKTVPLLHYLLLSLLPLPLIRLSKNPLLAAANGQCMLFKAAVYKKHQFHQALGNIITEDIACMKMVKQLGYRGQLLLANGFIECRMYRNYEEALLGFSKSMLSGFGNHSTLLFAYLFFTILAYPFFFLFIPPLYLPAALLIILYIRIMISRLARQNVLENLLWHLPQMLSLLQIASLSIKRQLENNIEWKGRIIRQSAGQ